MILTFTLLLHCSVSNALDHGPDTSAMGQDSPIKVSQSSLFSSSLPIHLFSAFTENQCFGRELCARDSRLCLCWMWASSLFYLPSFPIWDGCCKAAKSGAVITLPQRVFSVFSSLYHQLLGREKYGGYARRARVFALKRGLNVM